MSANRNQAGSGKFQNYDQMVQAFGKVKRRMTNLRSRSFLASLPGKPIANGSMTSPV